MYNLAFSGHCKFHLVVKADHLFVRLVKKAGFSILEIGVVISRFWVVLFSERVYEDKHRAKNGRIWAAICLSQSSIFASPISLSNVYVKKCQPPPHSKAFFLD